MKIYENVFKPVLDITLASIGLILLSPIFITVCVVLYFKNNTKVFFFQPRPGKNEKIFNIIKFKTMNDATDAYGELLPGAQRITATGIFVRKYSIDEIPQLLNVIKGDMSLIGPRPLLVRYLPRYNAYQKQRHNIKPGITGWAQVNGRNTIGWEQKFEYDIWYIEHLSFVLDLKIIGLTLYKIIKKDGIYSPQNDIVSDFMGTSLNSENL